MRNVLQFIQRVQKKKKLTVKSANIHYLCQKKNKKNFHTNSMKNTVAHLTG